MPRRMSCSLTVDAVRERRKTVTRRHVDTWRNLKPGDDYLVVASPGTRHVTIVHQRDYRPAVATEWAAGLAEYDSDECPDCGFVLADDMSGTLERTPRSREFPCEPCLWAHGPIQEAPNAR